VQTAKLVGWAVGLCSSELGITFTKLHCWRLTQYRKCVFLDADTLVLSNIDDLFERDELSAAPDAGWPDCFNSGVFVYVYVRPTHYFTRSLLRGGPLPKIGAIFSYALNLSSINRFSKLFCCAVRNRR